MLDETNLFLNPDEIIDEKTCFSAIDELSYQLNSLKGNAKPNFSQGVYIWGSAEVARRIIGLLKEIKIPLLGVFDSNTEKQGLVFENIVIEAPRTVKNYVIVASYHQPEHLLFARELFGEFAIAAWELLIMNPDSTSLPWNNLRSPDSLTVSEREKISQVSSRCTENTRAEFWRQVAARHFVSVLHTNKNGNLGLECEYFVPGIIHTHKDSIFLDLGAYNGDTIARFFKQIVKEPDNRRAIAVEADQNNFLTLLQKYNQNTSVSLLNAVINSESGILPFSESENSMGSSALFFEPNTFVPAVTIDNIFQNIEFTHIKFDIEGFERVALKGATSAIASHKSVWSVASYHLVDDLWVIPDFFPESYEIVISRHAPLPWDTTMHFIPKVYV
jgi:FkbM family methyltransferase